MANDITLRAILTGSSTGAVTAFEETALAADKAAKSSTSSMEASTGKIGGFFENLGAKAEAMGIPFASSISKFGSESKKAEGGVQGLIGKLGELGKVATIGGLAVAGVVTTEAIKMAEEYNKVLLQYQVAAKNQGESAKQYTAQLNKSTEAANNNGFSTTAATQAATVNARVTSDRKEQTKLLNVEMEYARAKNIDLASAADLVTKGYLGSPKLLKSVGDNLSLGSSSAKTLATDNKALAATNTALDATEQKVASGKLKGVSADQALATAHAKVSAAQQKLTLDSNAGNATLDAVEKKVKGSAKAYNETLGGSLDIVKAKVENLGIKLGQVLIPILEKVVKAVTGVVTWFTKHKLIAEILAGIIGGVLAAAIAVYVVNVGVKMVKSAQDAVKSIESLLQKLGLQKVAVTETAAATTEAGEAEAIAGDEGGAGMSAMLGPIGLVLIAATLLMTHWKQVKAVLIGIWHAIKDAAITVWDFIKSHIKEIIEAIVVIILGPIGLVVIELVKHWKTIQHDVMEALDAVVGFFTALPGRIVTALGDIVSTIWGALKNTVSWIDTNVIQPVLTFYMGIPGRIVTALGDIVGTIWNALKTSGEWIDQNVFVPLVTYFEQLPGRLLSGLGNIVGTVFGGLAGAWTWIKTNVYDPVVNGFKGLPGDIANVLSNALGVFDNVGKSIVNSVIGGINTIIDTIDAGVGGISIFGWHPPAHIIPDIPKLATGGPLAAGQLALVGENGPELFRPNTSGTVIPNSQIGNTNATTENNVTVNVASPADAHQIASEVGWALRTMSLAS